MERTCADPVGAGTAAVEAVVVVVAKDKVEVGTRGSGAFETVRSGVGDRCDSVVTRGEVVGETAVGSVETDSGAVATAETTWTIGAAA